MNDRQTGTAFGLLSFLVPLLVYAASISSLPQTWDYGEMQVVPYILGIAHPTGFPAFVLLGWIFSHVVALGTVAWRMNLLCAILMAGAASLVRLLARSFGAAQVPAFFASLAFAFTNVAWTKASHTDVHTLALLLSLAVFLAAMHFSVTGNPRSLVLGAAALGFGLATHPNVIWSGLALVPGTIVLARRDLRAVAFVVCAAMLPLALYAYLPIRSAIVEAAGLDPAARAPFYWHGEVAWNIDRPSTLDGFRAEVSGSEFHALDSLNSVFDVTRYLQFAAKWFVAAADQLSVVTALLAGLGVVALFLRPERRMGWLSVLTGAFAAVPFAYSYPAELDFSRYLFASFAVTAALAAASSEIVARLARPWIRTSARAAVAVALAAIAYHVYGENSYHYNGRTDLGGQPTIDEVRAQIPDGAVVLSNWIDGTALSYGAYVDKSLGSRVALIWLRRDADRYLEWAKTERVYALVNFIIADEVKQLIPNHCLHELPLTDSGHHLFEVRCGSTSAPR